MLAITTNISARGMGLGLKLGALSGYIFYILIKFSKDQSVYSSYLFSMIFVLVPFDALSVLVSTLDVGLNVFHIIGNVFIFLWLRKILNVSFTKKDIKTIG
jgi:hypothetical protein